MIDFLIGLRVLYIMDWVPILATCNGSQNLYRPSLGIYVGIWADSQARSRDYQRHPEGGGPFTLPYRGVLNSFEHPSPRLLQRGHCKDG